MMRSVAMALLAIIAVPADAALAQATPTVTPAAECRPGPLGRSMFTNLRTNPVALCPYGVEELYRRIGALLDNATKRLDIGKVAPEFGLPLPGTTYDSDRIAAYAVTLNGSQGWTMRLEAIEARYPLDGKPAVFRPGIHPTRLVGVDTLDVTYDIVLRLPDDATPGRTCMSVQDAADRLERAGWKDDTFFAQAHERDGGYADPTFRAPGGGSTIILHTAPAAPLTSREDRISRCLTRFTVLQPPTGKAKR